MLDKRILEQLFHRNYSEMIHLARVLLGDDGEAEDVVQDTFLRIVDSDVTITVTWKLAGMNGDVNRASMLTSATWLHW